MCSDRVVRFHLDGELGESVRAGRHNFLNKVGRVLTDAGFAIELCPDTLLARRRSASLPGYALFHMQEPVHDRSLTVRRVYHYPFWAIERSAQRWNWTVARTRFDPAAIDPVAAARFRDFWRKRLFGKAPHRREGYVYVPLQGRLLEQRSFQTCSPVEMIAATLANQPLPVVATLHPKEAYSRAERGAIERLAARHQRLTVSTGDMERHLAACDLVVTQNSSAAFNGYFYDKPAVLFARIDFHHIAANVAEQGPAAAFDAARQGDRPFAAYLYWFWQIMAINAVRPDAGDRIRLALARGGWPL